MIVREDGHTYPSQDVTEKMNNTMKQLRCIVVLAFFKFLVNGQFVQTPCPGVFEYQADRDNVFGMIRIPSDGPVTVVTTQANFTVAKKLTSVSSGNLFTYSSDSE